MYRRLAPCAALAIVFASAAGCGDNIPAGVAITAGSAWADALGEFVSLTDGGGLELEIAGAPAAPTADTRGYQIAVLDDDPSIPLEGYRIDAVPGAQRSVVVHATDVLGAQYGLADALEQLGFRFRHPFDTYLPYAPVPAGSAAVTGIVHQPQVRVRGLQLHTLHPIEGYFAVWEPSAGATNDFHRIVDWLVKNRGNYLQWTPLNNIYDPTELATWQPFTRALIDYAHMRGIRVGVNIELLGLSNLQEAFDVIDNATQDFGPQIAARLPIITTDLPFDVYDISFGEFTDADPDTFLDAINETAAEFHQLAPAAEVHGVIHVGGTQLVTYMGQTMIYYFLLQFADPSITADVHTVMYFDLFESADNAYQMADFSPHRQFLIDHMCSNQRASYFPEDAYWITFDDSVPMYLPLYVRTRWYDLQQLRLAAPPPCSPLDEHLVFSSGWEWGYWLHDTTSMRASYELPASPAAEIAQQLAPDSNADVAKVVSDLADEQHDALIGQSLAAYLAGRDAVLDGGAAGGEISEPTRVSFDDLVAETPGARAQFGAAVLAPLIGHALQLDALVARLGALPVPDSRWGHEIRDGVAVDRDRAHYIAALYEAVLDHLAGDDASADVALASAKDYLADGQAVVHGRDADLHDTHGARLYSRSDNDTIYPYGYLYMADTLCYWYRELDQVDAVLGDGDAPVRSCDIE